METKIYTQRTDYKSQIPAWKRISHPFRYHELEDTSCRVANCIDSLTNRPKILIHGAQKGFYSKMIGGMSFYCDERDQLITNLKGLPGLQERLSELELYFGLTPSPRQVFSPDGDLIKLLKTPNPHTLRSKESIRQTMESIGRMEFESDSGWIGG